MTEEQARSFAEQWAERWNRRDVDAVLAHFADDVVFTSPVALAVTGSATIRGKQLLGTYWRSALERHHSLRFTLQRTLWDPAKSELAIIYDRDVNGRRERGIEVLTFGADRQIVRGEAFYGLTPTDRTTNLQAGSR